MKIQRIFLPIVGLVLFSCADTNNGLMCTEEYRMLTVTIYDSEMEPIILTDYYTLKTSTDEIIDFKPENQYIDSIYTINGTYILFTDSKMAEASKSGTEFRFQGFIDTLLVVNKPFIIRNDGCHIELVSGNPNIVLN